ncbi:hypothetical protein ACFSFY_14140 [Sporosarcina siberiensis]|uniref:Transcriptional regulator n=1 Tax=Sporosarcina siberiensis TaxID=1365606 RepID=A0ABW4SI25_9BACL
MKIRIAAFGSDSMIERVSRYVPHFQGVELIPYVYETIEESIELVRSAKGVDVLLFTGSIPYTLSKHVFEEKGIPAVYVPLDEYVVVLTLFNVKYHLRHKKFSLDILDNVDIYEIFGEVGLDHEDVYIKNLSTINDHEGKRIYEEIIQFHEKLWNDGKIEIAVTCISIVYKALSKKGIPVIRMNHPQKTIKDTFRQAMMLGKLEVSKKAQIVVGIVSIDNYQSHVIEKGNYFAESNSLLLHQLLLDFSTEIDSSLQQVGKDKFIIYGTKGSFEIITNNYNDLSVLFKIKKLIDMKVNVGFGFGLTAKEAEYNAQIALHYSSESKDKTCAYIMNVDKSLLGPLTQSTTENTQGTEEKFDFDYIIEISTSSGINMKNIRKIVEFCKLRNYKSFSATELAEYMQISRRSAERFTKILLDSNHLKVVGEERVSQIGRPTTLFELIVKI